MPSTSEIVELSTSTWSPAPSQDERDRAADALEAGHVVFLPRLRFGLLDSEVRLLRPDVGRGAKNISMKPMESSVRGTGVDAAESALMHAMMARFSSSAGSLLRALLPRYGEGLQVGRTSYRPAEIAGRQTSWRKDDTRLHVDSFPASPLQGRRILRVFSNINPNAQSRKWRIGEPFEAVARRFIPQIARPRPGVSTALQVLHVTRGRRTPYDHYMLELHDAMKADMAYQAQVAQASFDFPPGTTWICYTDHVSHAAMGGQYALEQTYYLPVSAMVHPEHSPLRVLERLLERQLA
jgi:hypothetical protein